MPFMKPYVYKGCYEIMNEHGESCVYPIDDNPPVLGEKSDFAEFSGVVVRAEWYPDKFIGRYSANGYMDCTEWSGPYNTDKECLDAINEMYGEEDEPVL